MNTAYPHLLSPVQLGAMDLANRVIMAPLTRCRAEAEHMPTELMAEYYAQRASSGLIIAEATMAMPGCSAFWKEPGIYSEAQILAWKQVTDAVHAKGGKIVLQVWHGGRACHPALNNGKTPVAPSAIAIESEVHPPEGKLPYTVPDALTLDAIADIVAGFKQAAINAQLAGFDGVEVHGANGYLLDQFLRDGSNKRTDSYGGSIENRAKLLLEVLAATIAVWGSERVGLRISPTNSYNSMQDSNPIALTQWLCQKLNEYNLAYLHVMRGDFFGIQKDSILDTAIEYYQGNLIGNMGYDASEAETAIANKSLAAVAFGVAFIANPDLVARFQTGAALNEADANTFYTEGKAGYTDYPFLASDQ